MRILATIGLVFLVASSAFGMPFSYVNITSAQLMSLGHDNYRVHLRVDWGGDVVSAEGVLGDLSHYTYITDYHPLMSELHLTGISGATNFAAPASALGWAGNEPWSSSIAYMAGGRLGSLANDFWFDFSSPTPLTSIALQYEALIYWGAGATYVTGENFALNLGESVSHRGSVIAFAIPEPGTLLLMGLGLVGLTTRSRRRRS